MMSEIKLTVSENEKTIQTITKETLTGPSDLLSSIEQFQVIVNETLTKLIEKDGGTADEKSENCEDDDGESSDDEKDGTHVSPKKRRI